MAIEDTHPQPAGAYPSMFRQYVVRGVEHTLTRVNGDPAMGVDDREQALVTLTYALKLPEAWPVTRELLVALAPGFEQAGYRETWLPYIQQGIERCQQGGDLATEGELRFQLGMLRQLLGNLEDAYQEYQASGRCFEQTGDRRREARALGRMANLRRLQGRPAEARQLVDAVGRLLSPEDYEEQGYAALVWGGLATDERNWPLAVARYEESLALWERTEEQRLIAWGLNNLGLALRLSGRPDEAAACYERAIALLEELGDRVHVAVAQTNLGNIYLKKDKFDLALGYYRPAEDTFREVHDNLRLAFLTTNLSMVYRGLGQLDQAAQYAEASIELLRQIGDVSSVINAMTTLAAIHLDAGRTDEAEAVLRQAQQEIEPIKDEPGSAEQMREIDALLEKAAQAAGG